MTLALAEARATDLAKRLADRESTSCTLQLRIKVNGIGQNKRPQSQQIEKGDGVVSGILQPRVRQLLHRQTLPGCLFMVPVRTRRYTQRAGKQRV